MKYADFLRTKKISARPMGLSKIPALNRRSFDWQQDVTAFLLAAGRGAAFLDTGLGKSLVSLDWGRVIHEHTNKPILMLAPLAVGPQHAREAVKFDVCAAKYIRDPKDLIHGINITNYENMHKFDAHDFGGVILDESSIIKSFTGITTRKLMKRFDAFQFKLCCTATPAPNDHMELGQHSQFLEVMESSEMLSRFFIADQSEMGRYRLKRHGVKPFWSWVASWARCLSKPSDLGYSDDGFALPELETVHSLVKADISTNTNGLLMRLPDTSATMIHKEKRLTADIRAERCAEILSKQKKETWVVWCDTDYEADALIKVIPEAIEVRGSMSPEKKEELIDAFTQGKERVLITKPRVAGFGLNWQHCARTCFAGISFSYEQYYQAIRRFYRFGQQRAVEAHVVMSDTETAIWQTVKRKMDDHETMKKEMASAMGRAAIQKEVMTEFLGDKKPKFPAFLKG